MDAMDVINELAPLAKGTHSREALMSALANAIYKLHHIITLLTSVD